MPAWSCCICAAADPASANARIVAQIVVFTVFSFDERVEQAGALPLRRRRQPCVPVVDRPRQRVAQARHVAKPFVELLQFRGRQFPDAAARGAAPGPGPQHVGQFPDREPDRQRAPHHADAVERFRRVDAIAVGAPRRPRDQAGPFVMAQGVGADPRQPRQLSCQERAFLGRHKRILHSGMHSRVNRAGWRIRSIPNSTTPNSQTTGVIRT